MVDDKNKQQHEDKPKSANRSALWAERLASVEQQIDRPKLIVEGHLTRMVGLTLEAVGCHAPVGSRCLVEGPDGKDIEAEVVGFSGEKLYLMPTGRPPVVS